jgi:hypothetical protein
MARRSLMPELHLANAVEEVATIALLGQVLARAWPPADPEHEELLAYLEESSRLALSEMRASLAGRSRLLTPLDLLVSRRRLRAWNRRLQTAAAKVGSRAADDPEEQLRAAIEGVESIPALREAVYDRIKKSRRA